MAGKTRVHELAKELGVAPKVVIDQLDVLGLKDLTSASAIDDGMVPQLRASLEEKAAEFVRKEDERRESERTASIRARVEAAKAVAAKAARARTRKPADPNKPKPDRAKSAVKTLKAQKAAPTFVTAKAKPTLTPTLPPPIKPVARPATPLPPLPTPIEVVARSLEPRALPVGSAAESGVAVAPAAPVRPGPPSRLGAA